MGITKSFTVLVALIFIAGCAKESSTEVLPKPPTWAIEPEFQTYVDDFLAQGESRDITVQRNLMIVMKETLSAGSSGVIGLCHYPNSSRAYPLVEIKKSYWDSASEDSKKALIYHELGHCLLFRDHNTSLAYAPTLNKQIPLSVMYPYIITGLGSQISNFFSTYIAEYWDELFDSNQVGNLQTIVSNSATTPNQALEDNPDIGGYSAFSEDGSCTHNIPHDH